MSGGPILLLDKCALQALSRAEVKALPHCFTINIPPILTQEIQGDLKKKKGLGKHGDSQMEVQTLAEKLIFLSTQEFNLFFRKVGNINKAAIWKLCFGSKRKREFPLGSSDQQSSAGNRKPGESSQLFG